MLPTPQQLKAARIAAGLTQKQAAQLVGVQERAWCYYEAGRPISYCKWRIFQLEAGIPPNEIVESSTRGQSLPRDD